MDRGGQTVSATRFAELTGVSRERLRTWERRFGFPEPVRVGSGPRRYLVADAPRVVAVRFSAQAGTPLETAIADARAAAPLEAPSGDAFRAAVEHAPVPVALVSGPEPVVLAWANGALRGIEGAPAPGETLARIVASPRAGALLHEHFTRDTQAAELEHPPWGGSVTAPGSAAVTARSIVYRLPAAPGERPLLAIVGIETRGEHEARAALARSELRLARLERQAERHERWLDALGALASEFQHEPGPDVIASALDVLIRQTEAVDVGLASYVSGRLELHGTRRGALGATALTVAAHPQVGRALRDVDGAWLDEPTARSLGVPAGLHAVGVPVAVAGEVLGLLVMVFDEVEPLDDDNRRLLGAISAAIGFALLRDRLVRELAASAGASGDAGADGDAGAMAPATGPERPGRRFAAASPPDG
ncbi:MAG TPA: MerR family transcriptional regulator [Baekduia sp.]|uniref:MerR family transcriptional regulator n=1 Tax=Baekduia sp. TaxID=2600305 RepID=UPI002D78B4FC|nr:MerR family transcriptional regulator [Baekduia sp.]HET6507600.1 MerR family transcriptional regulator [Baekduia sp.]